MQVRIDSGHAINISVLAAEHTIAPMESSLPKDADGVLPALAFLRNVQDWLRRCGLADTTITAAWQFWILMGRNRAACAAAVAPQAEIAYWFKLDPFALSEAQQVGLIANLHRMQCQERIYRRDYQATDYEGVYRLYKAAFEDEDLAQRQKSAAFAMYVERCTRAH